MPNLNRANISETPLCLSINNLIEGASARVPEENTRKYLGASAIGSECLRRALRFIAVGGHFRGHCDGIIVVGPKRPGIGYPCLWENKCLGSKGWRNIAREGLIKASPQYAAQVWIYQAYLNLTDRPALFTAVNADTCEHLHLLVPFDAERAQEWSDRAVTVIKATRAGELLPRVRLALPYMWPPRRCWG